MIESIKPKQYYSIIVDDTMDAAKIEQMSVCVRYADEELKVHENFIGFYDMASTTASALLDRLKLVLNEHSLQSKI